MDNKAVACLVPARLLCSASSSPLALGCLPTDYAAAISTVEQTGRASNREVSDGEGAAAEEKLLI